MICYFKFIDILSRALWPLSAKAMCMSDTYS